MIKYLSMIIVLEKRIIQRQLKQVIKDLEGYIKFVADVEKGILAVGGLRHFEAERVLLDKGSKQENLWGGGWDTQTNEIDFDSMINIRPVQGNPSREVLSTKTRDQILKIVDNLLR